MDDPVTRRPAWIAEYLEAQSMHRPVPTNDRDYYIQQGYEDYMLGRVKRDCSYLPATLKRAYNIGWMRGENEVKNFK